MKKLQQQPYARGARAPGAALTSMLRGRTAGGYNPQDAMRSLQTLKKAAAAKRPPRPDRPKRPPR